MNTISPLAQETGRRTTGDLFTMTDEPTSARPGPLIGDPDPGERAELSVYAAMCDLAARVWLISSPPDLSNERCLLEQ